MQKKYIHGTQSEEQARLQKLNEITNQSFIDYMGDFEQARVLDIGCGLGNLLSQLAENNPDSFFTGIEISREQYDTALVNTKHLNNLELRLQDALQADLPENHFDIIYCRYFLEHVPDPQAIVGKMYTALKPGGKIVVQENDLHNVLYYPEIEKHDGVKDAFCQLQIEMGGNPYIGREIYALFSPFDFSEVQLHIEPEIYTDREPEQFQLWMSNSLHILKGARENLLAKHRVEAADFDAVLQEMEQRIRMPKGISLFYWNRLTAIK